MILENRLLASFLFLEQTIPWVACGLVLSRSQELRELQPELTTDFVAGWTSARSANDDKIDLLIQNAGTRRRVTQRPGQVRLNVGLSLGADFLYDSVRCKML